MSTKKSGFYSFASFEELITPKLITLFYWITTMLLIVASIISWIQGGRGLSLGLIVALIVVRIAFELVMVSFKNNEYLRRICEAVTKDDGNDKAPHQEWRDNVGGESTGSPWKKQ